MFKRLIMLCAGLLLASACTAQNGTDAAAAKPSFGHEAGVNYFLIEPPQPTSSGDNIEVLEVYSYACVHCAHFQPFANELKTSLPAYARFAYMPALFSPAWEPYARAFYTAEAMGVLDKTHQPLFDALHRDQRPLRTFDDLVEFYGEHGVDTKKFEATAHSFEVESKLARSREMVPRYQVDGTPTVIVNGKYRVTGASAGGYPQMVELIKWLVEKEHAAETKGGKAKAAK